jgi:hypothetical protein
MPATAHDMFQDDPETNAAAAIDARREDYHWNRFFHLESYVRPGLDYEDYAAAYCTGYIGYVQYGGCFEDAEKSLCSNWVRLKGDSRLSMDQALPAIRAAWERLEQAATPTPQWSELYAMAGEPAQQQRWDQAANQPGATSATQP